MAKRQNRSDKYQYLIVESCFPHDLLEAFCLEDSIERRLNPFKYDDRILDLQESLSLAFWRVVNTCLTERQATIIKLVNENKTQVEIAKILGVNQSSITKSLNGNVDYSEKDEGDKSGGKKRSYGGTLKKIKKIVENDPEIKEILRKIADLRDEVW